MADLMTVVIKARSKMEAASLVIKNASLLLEKEKDKKVSFSEILLLEREKDKK